MPKRLQAARLKTFLDVSVTCAIGVAAVLMIWRSWVEPGRATESPRRAEPQFEKVSESGLTTSISGAPSVGSTTAPVVLIEYSDFECPYCARHASDTFMRINDEFITTGKVQYVFRNYPLEQIHPTAFKAAQAASCANAQGKFMEMRAHLFANRRTLAQMDWTRTASKLELDDTFATCLMNARADDIDAELQEGTKLGLTSTPTFFLGTRLPDGRVNLIERLNGAAAYAIFKEKLEAAWAYDTGRP